MKIKLKCLYIVFIIFFLYGCVSIGKTATNPRLAGEWINYNTDDGSFFILRLSNYMSDKGWRGTMAHYNASSVMEYEIEVSANMYGMIALGTNYEGVRQEKFKHEEIYYKGLYLGERLTITFLETNLVLYKRNPSKPISLAGTTWYNPYIYIAYVFNDDNSFNIDLYPPYLQILNNSTYYTDTEGTYSVNGIELSLTYPNGKSFAYWEGYTEDGELTAIISGVNTDLFSKNVIVVPDESFTFFYGLGTSFVLVEIE